MPFRFIHVALVAMLLAAAGLAGCNSAAAPAAPPAAAHEEEHDHDSHAHDHPTTGPHGGQVIELGDEQYHAELVHDEQSGTTTVYILDRSAKQAEAIDAPSVTLNLTRDDRPEQFTLAASPDEGESAGRSSRFTSDNANLGKLLDSEGVTARLVVRIGERSYSGTVEHHHEH